MFGFFILFIGFLNLNNVHGYWYPVCGIKGCSSFPKFFLPAAITFQEKPKIENTPNSLAAHAVQSINTLFNPFSYLFTKKEEHPILTNVIQFTKAKFTSMIKEEKKNESFLVFMQYYYAIIIATLFIYLIFYFFITRKLVSFYKRRLKRNYERNFQTFLTKTKLHN